MAHAFYPFVDNEEASGDDGQAPQEDGLKVRYPARIAVYDDLSSAPRVVVVEPSDVRGYLEEITQTVTRLAKEQGGTIPFTVIREIVENYIHAYFIEPTISILDGGNTIRFADQGPGIADKDRAMEFGTTSATRAMKHYIRGTGAGLPLVQEYMEEHNGSLRVEDNISSGTIITISTKPPVSEADDEPQARQAMTPAQPAVQPPVTACPQGYATPVQAAPAIQQPTMQPDAAFQPQPQGYYVQPSGWQVAPQQGGMTVTAAGMQPAAPQYAAGQVQQVQPQQPSYLVISERGELILSYLQQHESVGPTELRNIYGLSSPTWSRELKELEQAGLISKMGQKRSLTTAGRQFLLQRQQGA